MVLERLADAGILSRHRNQKKGDSWEAKELFALLDEFERRLSRPTHTPVGAGPATR